MTDHLFSQFITRIRASPHGANTVIVVVSDHLAMRNSATELLQRGARRNLFLVLPTDGTPPAQVQRRGSTFDIASTVLPFLGYEATVGLGRDLRDPGVPPEVAEEIAQAMETGIWSEAITGLWDFPVLRKNLAIDPAAKTVEIDGQKFWIPILIRMDADMQTKLEFPWDLEGRDRVLVSTVQGLPADTAFLLIDRCENVGALEQSVAETGWCLIAGYGDQINTAISFTDPREFARAELRAMTGFWPR